MNPRADSVLRFWFGEPGVPLATVAGRWFTKDPAFDAEVRTTFGDLMAQAARGELDEWARPAGNPRELLALVVLLDQFPRNVYRESPRAFEQDAKALGLCQEARRRGDDEKLGLVERAVLYLPLMHAEDGAVQDASMTVFHRLADDATKAGASEEVIRYLRSAHDFAVRHARVVERFGRFPHRNEILKRPSRPEEEAFLKEPGSSF